jgi:Fe-Mn family superoxide dismutase
MTAIQPRTFDQLARLEGLSERSMIEHYRLYEGYVRKFNDLSDKLRSLQRAETVYAGADSESVKVDLTYALGAIKNHELFFEILRPAGGTAASTPEGLLADAIKASFHSFPQYLADLKQTAVLGRGWAWTAFDLDHGTLFNYAGVRNGIPVWNTIPIVGIDLYGHAYFYDFGSNKAGYIDVVLRSVDWQKVAARLAAAQRRRAVG